jgi:hypothetical protein
MKKDHRLQIQFDRQMAAWLKKEAERKRSSVAQVIRTLVLEEMAKVPGKEQSEK